MRLFFEQLPLCFVICVVLPWITGITSSPERRVGGAWGGVDVGRMNGNRMKLRDEVVRCLRDQ